MARNWPNITINPTWTICFTLNDCSSQVILKVMSGQQLQLCVRSSDLVKMKWQANCSFSLGTIIQTFQVFPMYCKFLSEPRHEKTCLCHMWTTKAQISLHTCEPSRIIREPPGNASRLPHSREWDRTSRMWKYKKKIFFFFFFSRPSFLHLCMVIMATCCWKAINS